jgi:flagellar motor protein MotB
MVNSFESFFFKIASSTIVDDARVISLAERLLAAKAKEITLHGHSCDVPIVTPESKARWGTNEKLSEDRAQSVASALKLALASVGSQEIKISVVPYGDTIPASKFKEVNRRVDVVVVE